jgi:3-deoxy-D-arabino-heptulosonate 7-phosphate (DAHP) synthase
LLNVLLQLANKSGLIQKKVSKEKNKHTTIEEFLKAVFYVVCAEDIC